MEESEKSPVLDRLVQFMNSTGLSSSQFADTTGIPRPSLSQMLHGRNKSVNNQVLAKLNAAFPNLNILWLLFGQGEMLLNPNIKISEPENDVISSIPTPQALEFEDNTSYNDEISNDLFSFGNGINDYIQPESKTFRSSNTRPTPRKSEPSPAKETESPTLPPAATDIAVDESKKISSIIVLYTDGSFETFKPAVS